MWCPRSPPRHRLDRVGTTICAAKTQTIRLVNGSLEQLLGQREKWQKPQPFTANSDPIAKKQYGPAACPYPRQTAAARPPNGRKSPNRFCKKWAWTSKPTLGQPTATNTITTIFISVFAEYRAPERYGIRSILQNAQSKFAQSWRMNFS